MCYYKLEINVNYFMICVIYLIERWFKNSLNVFDGGVLLFSYLLIEDFLVSIDLVRWLRYNCI